MSYFEPYKEKGAQQGVVFSNCSLIFVICHLQPSETIENGNGLVTGATTNGHILTRYLRSTNSFTHAEDDMIVEDADVFPEKYKTDGVNSEGMKNLSVNSATENALEKILLEMSSSQEKHKLAEKKEEIAEQWRHVAAMYDRILFVVFLLVIFGITAWFLTLHPTAESQRV